MPEQSDPVSDLVINNARLFDGLYVKQGLCPLDWACRDETSDAADDYGGPR